MQVFLNCDNVFSIFYHNAAKGTPSIKALLILPSNVKTRTPVGMLESNTTTLTF